MKARLVSLILLTLEGSGIFLTGLLLLWSPTMSPIYSAAIKPMERAAAVGALSVGVFGLAVTWIPFRRGERWAWWLLWLYPAYLIAHHAAVGLWPGVSDIIFISLPVVALLLVVRDARQ
jgi:hypothetical protein